MRINNIIKSTLSSRLSDGCIISSTTCTLLKGRPKFVFGAKNGHFIWFRPLIFSAKNGFCTFVIFIFDWKSVFSSESHRKVMYRNGCPLQAGLQYSEPDILSCTSARFYQLRLNLRIAIPRSEDILRFILGSSFGILSAFSNLGLTNLGTSR